MVGWEDFNSIGKITGQYLPPKGEGDNMATQACVAINKLVFKWYNDGDVFDNRYYMEGWANDLSTYANWLYNHLEMVELNKIEYVQRDDEYEQLLFDVASMFTEEYLKELEKLPKTGSVYTEEGPFKFVEYEEDEEEW